MLVDSSETLRTIVLDWVGVEGDEVQLTYPQHFPNLEHLRVCSTSASIFKFFHALVAPNLFMLEIKPIKPEVGQATWECLLSILSNHSEG